MTSIASVVEMTGNYSLTLPVMLAVGIAAGLSKRLTYGTIYTTKLLRRGTDIERTKPGTLLRDLTVADAMQPVAVGWQSGRLLVPGDGRNETGRRRSGRATGGTTTPRPRPRPGTSGQARSAR